MDTVDTASDLTLIRRYDIDPGGSENHHHEYQCAIHCDCPDHFYRSRECKHIRAWLVLFDVGLVTV